MGSNTEQLIEPLNRQNLELNPQKLSFSSAQEDQIATSSPYIELLKKTLVDYSNVNSYEYHPLEIVNPNWKTAVLIPVHKLLRWRNFAICKVQYVDEHERRNGYDWPARALTMIGLNRLSNIETCMRVIARDGIEGDVIETGVWRGGATILMKALLKELNLEDRKVWLADSFEGLPKPNSEQYPADKGNPLHSIKILRASLDEVKQNFKQFDLLDDNVIFVKGWFKDTLHIIEVEKLALLRLDGDLYESTILALKHLYPKLSVGGYVIIDDYNAFPYCKQAVDDYRLEHGITEAPIRIDDEAIYWRKLQ